MYKIILLALLFAVPVTGHGFELDDPSFAFDEVVFEHHAPDDIFSPRARKKADEPPVSPDGAPFGWSQADGGSYAEFDPAEVFPEGGGSLEVEVVLIDPDALGVACGRLDSLITIYDKDNTAFFSVGINAREVSVSSLPRYPVEMEEVFGGGSFVYGPLLDGPVGPGTNFRVCVQWGAEPSDSRVYINGRRVGLDLIEGPRNMGPPGFEPTKTLSGYMHGFTASDGTAVGPPDRFVIGRIGLPVEGDRLVMGPPRSVAIVSVRITNFPIHD